MLKNGYSIPEAYHLFKASDTIKPRFINLYVTVRKSGTIYNELRGGTYISVFTLGIARLVFDGKSVLGPDRPSS